jgi:galacturonosyltransferase
MILANNDVGLYKFREELIEKLITDNEVYICLPNGEFIENLVELGCVFIPCDLLERHGTNPLKEIKLISWYGKVMKEYNPDLVLTYTIKPNVYGGMVCAKMGIPYIANITGLGTAVENRGCLQLITLTLYRCGLRKAKKVFFQNVDSCNFMIKHKVVKGGYDILPGSGVNLDRFKVSGYPDDDKVKFLFISRIMKEKGIDQYLEAANEIRKEYPNTEFHICGSCENEYKGKLDEYIQKNIVIYHGMIREVAQMLEHIHCVVHPTYYPEGISNVLLEACASGRPIITTDRSGCREVVDDGVNGYMIPQKDKDKLVEAIGKFLNLSYEEKKQMGLNARKKVERQFDRQLVVEAYMREVNKG